MPNARSAPASRPPAPHGAKAPQRRERRKEARPGELLAAALALFVEKGFAATRVEEVAARAGVSKGTLFLYFPSKEELFKALVRHTISGRFTEWNEELNHFTGSNASLVRYCMHSWWERIGMTEAAGISKLVMSEAGTFPQIAAFYQQEVIGPGHDLLKRVLQRGVDSGEFRPLNMEYAVYSLIAPMIFLLMWQHSLAPCCPANQQIEPVSFIDSQLDLLLGGMLAPGSTPSPAAKVPRNTVPKSKSRIKTP
ncbi:TetR/AcrR family transcriptional regulator [Hydrogenophaga sp.]|uniref:TetR/AcrR family transcriptional regulator n=1 Tax=Hydrogenophaga sp. TaxID=1904254 RepID=UPI0025C25D1F|nr:TetR/AcrR family transcriptional regulator [Hydrogenophaga sp.]